MKEEGQSNSHRELSGWKQIASHLGVSEPTARKYLKTTSLPVYKRGKRYYAFAEELDRWLRLQRVTPVSKHGHHRQRAHWLIATVATVFAIAVVSLLARFLLRSGHLHSVALEETSLSALDHQGRVLWRKDMKDLLSSADSIRPNEYLLEDFDGDGHNEVAVTVHPSSPRTETSKLVTLDDDGKLLWVFVNGKELTVGGRYFEPFYEGKQPRWLDTPKKSYIINVAAHTTWYPTQVALLQPLTGQPVMEYWHPGRISSLEVCDLDRDGESELYLGGINNPGFGTGHPSLAVLALPRPGESFPTRDTFFVDGNPQETQYILFPRYDIFEVQEFGASVLRIECQEPERLMLGIGTDPRTVAYVYIDSSFEIEDIRPAEGVIQLHKKLYVGGFLDHPYHPHELDEWGKVAKFRVLPNANRPDLQHLFQ